MIWYGVVYSSVAWYGKFWYDMIGYSMVWYGMVWYGMVWYGMVWYGMLWYDMVMFGIVWYDIKQYGKEYTLSVLPQILCHLYSYISENHHSQRYPERICPTNLIHLYEDEAEYIFNSTITNFIEQLGGGYAYYSAQSPFISPFQILTVFLENMSGFDVNANMATSVSLAGCWIILSESEACKVNKFVIPDVTRHLTSSKWSGSNLRDNVFHCSDNGETLIVS